MIVNKKTKKIISTKSCNGKKHDFKLFKESKTSINPNILVITDAAISRY